MEGVNGQLQTKYQKIAAEYSKVRHSRKIITVSVLSFNVNCFFAFSFYYYYYCVRGDQLVLFAKVQALRETILAGSRAGDRSEEGCDRGAST